MTVAQYDSESTTVEFNVQIFESRVWKDAYLKHGQHDMIDEHEHRIYVVKMTRVAVKIS